jgi:hypothetical protein
MRKNEKVSTASKKVVAAKAARRPAPTGARLLAPGDEVRLPLRIHNRVHGYDPRLLREDVPSRAIEGLVLSVREIATGKLVPLASGEFSQYVLEVLHNRSFDAIFSSTQNAGKSTMGQRPQNTPMWARVKSALHQMGAERKLISLADGTLNASPLATMLDGWRIVKVRANEIEAVE